MAMRFNVKKARASIIAKTNAIEVGKRYFLSAFYEKDGAFVTVLSKSTKMNSAGWPSSVEVRVDEEIGENSGDFYAAGKVHTVNASNLYLDRADASAAAKYGRAS